MPHKEQIKQLAMTANAGLTVYIAIHNSIFHKSATFGSLLKNLMGRGVPMSKLLEDAEKLLTLWDAIYQKIVAFRGSTYSSLSRDERHYLDVLARYVEALRKTAEALVDRQRLMNDGSKGGANNSMTWEGLKYKESVYQMAVQEYMTVGDELNEAAPIIFE